MRYVPSRARSASATRISCAVSASSTFEISDLEHLLVLADEVLRVGPVRDVGLLDAAVHRPRTTVFGNDAYATIDEKAAAMLKSILRNHALVDGNTRLGWLAVTVLYRINDLTSTRPTTARTTW